MNDRSVARPIEAALVVALAVGLLLIGAPPVLAMSPVPQQDDGESDPNGNGADLDELELPAQWAGEKKATATPVQQSPVIDGDLSDPAWSEADAIDDFMQREPDNGQPGSQRTVVRVVYDEVAIYFGFMMYDTEPERILASDLTRDSRLRNDDTIAVIMDTFHDHRNGFLFRVNPLATKYDAMMRNEGQVNANWDEKWEAATRITDEGWTAEFRIPFKALRYPTGNHVWGVDFKREFRRRNEIANWANYARGYRFNQVSQSGSLVGLRDLSLTERFRFKPYLSGGGSQFNQTEDPTSEATGDIGIEDFKVQLTPNLTADFTVNTDFAQVEDDAEQVNLTRFNLFFPEKREFFLESANNFSFGTDVRRFYQGPRVNLYHSRNIGLQDGEVVPILFGSKMTGKLGRTNIGLLNVQTDESEFGPGENYTSARVKQDLLGRSSVGAMVTNVQGGGEHNRVLGFDGDFTFFDYFNIYGFAARVDDSGLQENPWAGQFDIGWNSDRWIASGSYVLVQPEFRSDLGFITRTDIERQRYDLGWWPRPDFAGIRQVRVDANIEYISDTGGRIVNRSQGFSVDTNFQSGDSIRVDLSNDFERIDVPFTAAGLTIPAGDYHSRRATLNLSSYNARRVSASLNLTYRDNWFGGKRITWNPSGAILFNANFSLSPSYTLNQIDIPSGKVNTHTVTIRSAYNFTNRWLTDSLVQYNSVSSAISMFARLNYIYRTGDDFFLVYKQSTLVDGLYDGESDRSLTAKFTYSFDF